MSQVNLRSPVTTGQQLDILPDLPVDSNKSSCTTVELRILQDGKVYRSRAEQQRLNALGQWHHRRMRRRNRFRS